MAPRLMSPVDFEDRETGTTVPQCLDNQFMRAGVFDKVTSAKAPRSLESVTLSALGARPDPVARTFLADQRSEYMRSLLYSRRIVVNRAAFWNNPVLIQAALGDDRDAFVRLMAEGGIVPYLWDEESFGHNVRFGTLEDGRRAMSGLLREPALTDLTCVRLGGADTAQNAAACRAIDTEFRVLLKVAEDLEPDALDRLTSVLLGTGARADDRQELGRRIVRLAEFTRTRPRRDDVYAEFVTEGDPVSTPYRPGPVVFGLKKWIDAIYNANLPRFLSVRTFTPQGMPTPLDLELPFAVANRSRMHKLSDSVDDQLDQIVDLATSTATLKARDTLEKELSLPVPAPHELNHGDVLTIRGRATWRDLMAAIERHLDDPLDDAAMRALWQAYHEFLKDLGTWWWQTKSRRARHFAPGIARLFRWGAFAFGTVQIASQVFPVLPAVPLPFAGPGEMIPAVVESGLYLYEKKAGIDLRRSQAVRGLKKVQMINYADLRARWERIARLRPDIENLTPAHRDDARRAAIEEGN